MGYQIIFQEYVNDFIDPYFSMITDITHYFWEIEKEFEAKKQDTQDVNCPKHGGDHIS